MLSQALADAVADRGAYPLGAHVRDELAPAGRRFDPWSATVIGPQVPPTALAADDAPWTDLWASDPKAVGRLRPLTHAVGRSLAKTAEQHKTVLTDTAREYGERKIKASICGPHSREGDREGGEGLAGKGHKRQRHEDLGAKKRYATSIKYRGAPARALTKTELYAQPRPATKKHLIPTDGMDGGKLAGVISALAPAALALTKRFMAELPVHAALQWLTARVGHARFGPFVTEPLGAWTNLALFFAEPQDGAPARQKPLAAHTDRLNAQFSKPRWLEGARAQELSAALDARRGEVEHRGPTALVRGPDGIASRCSELASLRLQLGTSANRRPGGGQEQTEEEEEEEEEVLHETTAAFNLVTEGSLVGGYLVLLVGTLNGDPLPKGDAARYKLIIERKALLTFVPLNYEVLFSAGLLTHMGTPLSGSGLNARAILYLTGALERSVGHFEAAAAVADNAAAVREPPLLMNASDKRKVIDETQALEDTSRPDDLTLEQLEAAVAEFNSGELRGCPGNLEAAFALGVDALAELGARAGDEACERHVALKREKRSTVNGECYGPMPFPAMETRYQLLSPRVRARAAELERSGDPDAAAVLLVQFALVASIFTAPFLAHIFERGLLDQAPREQRTENAKTIFELVCHWEGDVAAVEYREAHPEATEAELHRVQVAARDGHMGPAMRYDRAQCPSRDAKVAHLQMALESVFGLAASAMAVAATRPTLSTFLAALSQAGKIQYLLGGFGRAKLAVELTWLGLIPVEETVRGGPGYAKELTEVLVAVGVLRQGVKAHKVHLAQLGEAIARAWKDAAAAHLRRLCAASPVAASEPPPLSPLAKRFEGALSWLLCREPLQREVEGLACEARRWRVGFLAHDCALRPDGRPYRARCSRRTNRPQAARPTTSTWRAGEVAVPVLSASVDNPCMRRFHMERRSLRQLMDLCGVPRQGIWADAR